MKMSTVKNFDRVEKHFQMKLYEEKLGDCVIYLVHWEDLCSKNWTEEFAD